MTNRPATTPSPPAAIAARTPILRRRAARRCACRAAASFAFRSCASVAFRSAAVAGFRCAVGVAGGWPVGLPLPSPAGRGPGVLRCRWPVLDLLPLIGDRFLPGMGARRDDSGALGCLGGPGERRRAIRVTRGAGHRGRGGGPSAGPAGLPPQPPGGG